MALNWWIRVYIEINVIVAKYGSNVWGCYIVTVNCTSTNQDQFNALKFLLISVGVGPVDVPLPSDIGNHLLCQASSTSWSVLLLPLAVAALVRIDKPTEIVLSTPSRETASAQKFQKDHLSQ